MVAGTGVGRTGAGFGGGEWRLALGVLHHFSAGLPQGRSQWKYATIVGVVSPVSNLLVLYAFKAAPLSHTAPAREVSMLFAALIGGHLLGEGDRFFRLIGAASIAVGVMALALG